MKASTGILVDSNVLLDVLTDDAEWGPWSAATLAAEADHHVLYVNPIVYAEVSIGFERIEDLEDALPAADFRRAPLPWEAAFLAGKAFVRYRRSGGEHPSSLPDFFIGAHALVEGLRLLTRDARRYQSYFPRLELVAPT